jgi:hypothetical protein
MKKLVERNHFDVVKFGAEWRTPWTEAKLRISETLMAVKRSISKVKSKYPDIKGK